MSKLSLEQRDILKSACRILGPQGPFSPHYNIIHVSGEHLKPARRLERRGLLCHLSDETYGTIYTGTDKGADAVGMARLGDYGLYQEDAQ